MKRSASVWNSIFIDVGVKPFTAAKWAPIFAEVIDDSTFNLGDAEIDDFLGQVLHESSMFERLEEGLCYRTPGRLMAVWPSRFKSLSDESLYLNNPEALANFVYGGRMGNTEPGDGWRNRGSGLIQITGADNLRAVQDITGIPVYDHPDLLRHPTAECLRVTIAWWEGHIPDPIVGNVTQETKRVNGGTVGLAERVRLTNEAREAMY